MWRIYQPRIRKDDGEESNEFFWEKHYELINNSSSLAMEIMTTTVFGSLILISKDFDDFISSFFHLF